MTFVIANVLSRNTLHRLVSNRIWVSVALVSEHLLKKMEAVDLLVKSQVIFAAQ